MKDILILAGGFGTRLRKLHPNVPKPLVPINGKPILHHCISECLRHGFENILISTHYEADQIRHSVLDEFGANFAIDFIHEEKPMGTAGAMHLALERMSDDFFILYSDIYAEINMRKLLNFHYVNQSEFTSVVHPNDHPYDSDIILFDPNSCKVSAVNAHKTRKAKEILPNSVNAAMYVANKNTIKRHFFPCWDIAQDLIPKLLKNNSKVFAYETVEYLKDMGSPSRLLQVNNDVVSGKVSARSAPTKRAAVFLDRDGCINKHKGYISTIRNFELEEGSVKAIKSLNSSKYLCFCVTNQPVIARGEASQEQIVEINNYMAKELGNNGAYLDSIRVCPHHPDGGFDGEVPSLKIECECRKPKPGMIIDLQDCYNIDLPESWMVGDTMRDVAAGKAAGCWTILLAGGDLNKSGKELSLPPDFIVDDIEKAANFILHDYEVIKIHALELISDFLNCNRSKHILITGVSRSGKSTFASVLRGQLERLGFSSHIFSTDYFLEKSANNHSRKFDTVRAVSVLNEFNSVNLTGLREHFHVHETNINVACAPIDVASNDIIIVEGEIPTPINFGKEFYHVSISTDKYVILKRFKEKYLKRGLSEFMIDQLYRERQAVASNTQNKIDLELHL